MSHTPGQDAPSPSPSSPPPAEASEDAVGRASHGRDDQSDEEHVRDVDPHPDTPDDFDEDASSPRQSIEAIPEDDA